MVHKEDYKHPQTYFEAVLPVWVIADSNTESIDDDDNDIIW